MHATCPIFLILLDLIPLKSANNEAMCLGNAVFLLFLSIVCVGINLETEGDVVLYAIIDYPKPFVEIHMNRIQNIEFIFFSEHSLQLHFM